MSKRKAPAGKYIYRIVNSDAPEHRACSNNYVTKLKIKSIIYYEYQVGYHTTIIARLSFARVVRGVHNLLSETVLIFQLIITN